MRLSLTDRAKKLRPEMKLSMVSVLACVFAVAQLASAQDEMPKPSRSRGFRLSGELKVHLRHSESTEIRLPCRCRKAF